MLLVLIPATSCPSMGKTTCTVFFPVLFLDEPAESCGGTARTEGTDDVELPDGPADGLQLGLDLWPGDRLVDQYVQLVVLRRAEATVGFRESLGEVDHVLVGEQFLDDRP